MVDGSLEHHSTRETRVKTTALETIRTARARLIVEWHGGQGLICVVRDRPMCRRCGTTSV